jgi:NTP pyrophosphatase (non-canonical NTP hydrolase)
VTLNLNVIQAEIEEVSRAHGWYEEARPWTADISLLASEVSEMLEAYRDFGLVDATAPMEVDCKLKKPEGVGSEAADVIIRLLDTCGRYNIQGDAVRPNETIHGEKFEDFTEVTFLLHCAVVGFATAETQEGNVWAAQAVYGLLLEAAEQYGFDLEKEIIRKIAYNRTRPYKHGKVGNI